MMIVAIISAIACLALIVGLFCHHQNRLKFRAHMMREAVRNHDFTFHLSLNGLFYGEKAMQEALNDLGQEISRLIAQNEVESWQRLTRVLTHEIMNVTTPIRSISQAYLEHPKVQGTSLEKGIVAINEASNHLVSFVDSYRKLTQLQDPVMADMDLCEVVNSVTSMYPAISFRVNIPTSTVLCADESLLRQVFVNTIKNALEAGAHSIAFDWHDSCLHISNDGQPIPPEVRRDIFIPFYTTKTSGSGIGLSLSRQIMTTHGGSLTLADKAERGYHTTFILDFGLGNGK